MRVRAGTREAVENCLGFPAIDCKACSFEPGQAFSESSDEASTYQMIRGSPCQDITVVHIHEEVAVQPAIGLLEEWEGVDAGEDG